MKKIIVGFFALALLLTSNSAFASGWNTDPDDCQVPLAVGNYTTNTGIRNGPDGCWTLTSVTANPGDTINVRAYYDNTSGSPQTNVRVTLSPLSSGSSSTFTFSGTLSSDQGSLNLGTVTINLSSSQTLSYGSTVWEKNNGSQTTFNGSQIINGGQSIGTVPSTVPSSPNLDGQGSLVTSFLVGSNGGGGNDTCTISNFTINGSTSATIQSGNSANLIWNTNGCTSVSVSGPNFNSSSANGNTTVSPTNSGTYTLTAYGNNGQSQTRRVEVYVNDIQQNNCYINTFTGNGSTNVTIQSGNAVNLYWSTSGCSSVSISGPGAYNNNSTTGNQTVYPTSNSNYMLTAYGNTGGSQTRYVYVNVNQIIQPPVQPPVINNCAVTTVATNVTQTSATLNGLITGSTGASYFQYGTTVNLGSQTVSRIGNGTFTEVITGLLSNTPYYFRLVSQCGGGISYGQIQVFSTLGTTVIRPVIVQGTTVIGTQSPIMLKIEDRFQFIGIGDTVDYTVTYKNIGKSKLTKPVLQVVVPKGITLTNSSAGTYQADTNTLTVPLQDLNPGDEGVVYLQGLVVSIDSYTAQIVTTAILVYTSPNGAQENAIAYVLNNPRTVGSVLGASAFWAGLGSIGLIGWLLILILILLIVLLTRRYYGSKVIHTTTPTGAHTTTTTNY